MQDKIRQLLSAIKSGDYRSIARGITIVENELPGHSELLKGLEGNGMANVIGITGPPGAGKSSLVNALLGHWTKQGKTVAVLAVDPSSPFNYGAILGDRIRMSEFYNNPGVYIRSLASRGTLGGLNAKIIEITDVLKQAPFDYIIVETVGVGQSEVEIAGLADCTVVALVPEAGDEVQTLKAGIMEIADVFVLNKADREAAETLFRHLKALMHQKAGNGREIPVLKTVATTKQGVEELAGQIEIFLKEFATLKEKRLYLLTEKSWQLIQMQRMQTFSRTGLRKELERALRSEAGFNLYQFISDYLVAHLNQGALNKD